MNTYNLSREWFNYCFDHPEKIKPNHTAVYFFAIENCNRLGWKKKFRLPSQMAMEAVGIKSYNTYIKTFNDLIDWGFFELIERSKNQYSANVIALSNFDKALNKALDKALIKHASKQSESTVQSIDSIYKQENKGTKEQENDKEHLDIFDIFRKAYPGTKKGNSTEFKNFKKKHKDWKEILPDLKAILDCQINQKSTLAASGQFVPPWKNLQTWINQRCWEEEMPQAPGSDKKLNFNNAIQAALLEEQRNFG